MNTSATKAVRFDHRTLSRTLPFALFMFFIGVEETLRVASHLGWFALSELTPYYLYPVKTLAVAAVLIKCLERCPEVRFRDLWRNGTCLAVVAGGVATCVLWVHLDWMVAVTGAPRGFDPGLLPEGPIRLLTVSLRVAGAVLVVPLMEELFWRSFLIRYLVDADFTSVPVGRFTWPSFLVTTVLFGLEHHLLVAGMVAGAIYNIILYKTRSLAQCVLAHAVTNLALACYVLHTGRWDFW